uniref:histidine kinase n=1 Tax=Solibacter usitatus (strain Ellin6076) TaxID=234267 RepID=Q02D70_SOLUE
MESAAEPSLRSENERLRAKVAELEGLLGPGRQGVNELRRTLEAFLTLAENSADAIATVDRENRCVYANAAFAKMIALSRGAVIGRTLRELGIPDAFARLWEDRVHGVFESGRALEIEDSLPTPGGIRLFETRWLPEPGPEGKAASVMVVYRDVTDRKRSGQALRESEERLRFACEVASLGTFDWNIQTGENIWTPQLEALHGLQPGTFPGTQSAWEKLIHPADRSFAARQLTESFHSNFPVEGEWRVVWPDGSVHWLAGRWQSFKDAAGEPVRLMGVIIDVTNRKQMELAVRQSEERFRLASQATTDAIWDVDLAAGTISWNETYSRLYGKPAETSDSWRWWIDRIHPEDRDRAAGGLRNAISNGASSWACDYRLLRADGGWAYINDRAYIARDELGNAWRVVGAMQDLTDRMRAEEALRESNLQYREVFDHISACLFLVDVTADGRFKFAEFNPAEEEAVGLSSEQVSGKFVEDVFSEDLAGKLTGNYRRCLEAGRVITYDDELNFPGGRRYFHSNLIPLQNAAGSIYRIIGACIDVTDLKRTQEEALAKQNLESLGVLASGIAHDFNNLLGGINAQAELIEEELAENSLPGEEVRKIKAAALRGSEIVRELMIYAGQDQARFVEAVDVSSVVAEMLELLKVSISKQAALRTYLAADLPPVSGNAPKIRQVVMNLVLNASEAIGAKHGVITLTTAHVRYDADLVTAGPADALQRDYVRLEVSDTGSGITGEAGARIFDPFFSTKFAGRGMGLAVVKGIVRDHGGTIDVSSIPGRGTTFRVLLPCSMERTFESRSAIPVPDPTPDNTRTGTILVVEDEALLREAVSKVLRRVGFLVVEAGDGCDAIELLSAHKEDLQAVLLDVTLPGISSREVLAEIRRVRPDLKVIVTSAYSKESVEASFTGLRTQGFIRKPFHLSDMVRLLDEQATGETHE